MPYVQRIDKVIVCECHNQQKFAEEYVEEDDKELAEFREKLTKKDKK